LHPSLHNRPNRSHRQSPCLKSWPHPCRPCKGNARPARP
jgi:hypothetical protein